MEIVSNLKDSYNLFMGRVDKIDNIKKNQTLLKSFIIYFLFLVVLAFVLSYLENISNDSISMMFLEFFFNVFATLLLMFFTFVFLYLISHYFISKNIKFDEVAILGFNLMLIPTIIFYFLTFLMHLVFRNKVIDVISLLSSFEKTVLILYIVSALFISVWTFVSLIKIYKKLINRNYILTIVFFVLSCILSFIVSTFITTIVILFFL